MSPAPHIIQDDGPLDARLLVIGEMDARDEEIQRKHFVGWSGQKMAGWWRGVGLARGRDMRVTNVVPYRHNLKNDIKLVPRPELDDWTRQLHERIAALTDPWLIVPTGNTALRALTGKVGITKHRGSIYEYVDNNGRKLKVIPTLHAAALTRMPGWERRCVLDWQRIASDLTFRELRLPERTHFIKPTLDDLRDYVEDARQRAECLVFDVETPRKLVLAPGRVLKSGKQSYKRMKGARRMTVCGFAFEPHFSMTVPLTASYWGALLPEAFAVVAELLGLPCTKGAQNSLFDRWWLAQYGIDVPNFVWDTRWMSHACDPLDAHDLGYQASIWTREPYWKDDTKEKNDESDPGESDIETFWRYNGKDCAVTHELVGLHRQRLTDNGRLRFYHATYVRLFDAMFALGRNGVRVADRTRRLRSARFVAKCLAISEQLSAIAGYSLSGDGKTARADGLSGKKILRYLYETLRLPPQHDRKTGSLTAKEVTVRRLMLRYPEKLGRDGEADKPGPLILTHRRTAILSKFCAETVSDTDERMHSQFGFTYTLRFTAGKAPNGRGANAQNTDRELLDLLIPNEGHVFLECDLCVDGETPILLANLTWQPAKSIKLGDEVVGFDEDFASPLGVSGSGSKYRRAVVTGNRPRALHCVKVVTDRGSVICSREHQWPVRRLANNRRWRQACDLRRGDLISFFASPWEVDRSYDAGWLAGFVSGEGWLSHTTSMSFGQNPGPTLDRALELLDERGYKYVFRKQNHLPKSKVISVRLLGGEESIRFMGQIRPSRLLPRAAELWENRRTWGHHKKPAKVIRVESVGVRLVYPVSTTTKTFIANGLLSHNSQAEDRVVKMLTKSPRLIERARAAPWDNDEHRLAASLIFRVPQLAVTKDQRYIGKRTRHAGNYGMHGKMHSDVLLKDGYFYTPEECEAFIATVIDRDTPEVRDWQQGVRQRVLRDRAITTTWGLVVDFTHERLNDDLYRKAYAIQPQNEVSLINKLWGLAPLHEYLAERWQSDPAQAQIVNEKHDSILVSVAPESAWEVAVFLRGSLERPRTYLGREMTIPCEFKLGRNGAMQHEFKRFPTRREFDEVVYSLV